jgi:ATP/maltotriose-dependent transcriptional regulator MalT
MPTPILATKLYIPPPRPEAVLRPRLIERLNEGLPGQSSDFARQNGDFARKLEVHRRTEAVARARELDLL